ncbi:hypothetical protein CH333_09980 [candidate division WOR-3 bacterium JGI_Cruoil_03_44_89]|uniref:Uncharacterized protein n=1 Tax=candidate division WOR-3 bacterium JGI_Cruoil_03_44_89 TaxID=1973748 RepID=A0A235BMU9_UNCW3|nr:MAG: hypothetical protein CH333_09980 [candidate division WOR-3 bacterium JGI_Cruoil_03_44_89]
MYKFKQLLIILLVPVFCTSMEIYTGGGVQIPLGEVGNELPIGSYLDLSVYGGKNIKPSLGMGVVSLGLPPSNINIYRATVGIKYGVFELKTGYHIIIVKQGEGRESENGLGLLTGIVIPLGNGGGYANIFYTSVPQGIGIGVTFNPLGLWGK